ncbi:MAG: hypothetical protein BWY91_03327 [bacterium ADurb.BinA028]|nr:MAG: hypothetical protein BWY91_03327 [bacterium ADurb.BinA028]
MAGAATETASEATSPVAAASSRAALAGMSWKPSTMVKPKAMAMAMTVPATCSPKLPTSTAALMVMRPGMTKPLAAEPPAAAMPPPMAPPMQP